MTLRDAAEFNEASISPDPAEGCDTLEDHIREVAYECCGSSLAQIANEVERRQITTRLEKMTQRVIRKLLTEGRLGALVDVEKLPGKDLLAACIGEIIEAPNPRLTARCIDFVFELGVQLGISETEMAEKEGVTKATASRVCVDLKEVYLNGRPARGMKSTKAVESYKQLRTGRSSRGPRTEWKFGSALKNAYDKQPALVA